MTNSKESLNELKEDLGDMAVKVNALSIIIGAPLWPKKESLNGYGRDLYDAILRDAKPYSLLIAREKFPEAFAMAAKWSSLADMFMEKTLINDLDASVRLANRRMIRVYKHYLDATGIYWPALERKSA